MQYYLDAETTYSEIHNRFGSVSNKKCINGKTTGSNKCIGFCNYAGHPGFIDSEIAQAHMCYEKNCSYFIKKRLDVHRSSVKQDNTVFKGIVEFVNKQSEAFEGLRIVDNKTKDNLAIFYYVTITNDYSFEEIIQTVRETTPEIDIEFHPIVCDYSDAVRILFGSRIVA